MVGRILKENKNLELAAINCDINCQIGSSPIENFHCKATPVLQRVVSFVNLHVKAKEKTFWQHLNLA